MRYRIRSIVILLFVLSVFMSFGGQALAALSKEARNRIEDDLRSRHFVARVNLYQATVSESGFVESEYDIEMIRVGLKILIEKVSFRGAKIRLRLAHPKIDESTYIDFVFSQSFSEDFSREKDVFDKMLDKVFNDVDEKKGLEKPGDDSDNTVW